MTSPSTTVGALCHTAVQQDEAFKYSQQPGVAGERLELKGGDAVRYDDNNHANDDVGITYAFYLKCM